MKAVTFPMQRLSILLSIEVKRICYCLTNSDSNLPVSSSGLPHTDQLES